MDVASLLPLLLAALALAGVGYILAYRREQRRAQEEEARRRAELGAWRAAEEDRRRQSEVALRRVEETLRKADEERRAKEERQRLEESARLKVEEAERAQEETNRREQEEALREHEARREKAEPEGERSAPLERGGRPRASSKDLEKQAAEKTHQRRPGPELVCWKREREWIPGVEIPDELLGDSALEVQQNSLPLTQDESYEARWRLADVQGRVVVRWSEGHALLEARSSFEEKCLIFKLSAQTQNRGRHVRFPSCGTYLVIAPNDWERDDALSGTPQWAPEAVSLSGYRAHYYSLSRNSSGKIAFRTPLGECVVIESEAPRFELVGTQLDDASEDVAPFFGGSPPRIRASDERGWTGVGAIVVGEEGAGARRWRMQFYPSFEVEQEMPPQLAARRGGWYFLRFYDPSDDLLESLDFRFLSAVKEIRILQRSPLPLESGHTPALVEIVCEPILSVQPGDEPASRIQVERENGRVLLRIPPDPACDETRWVMGIESGPQLEVAILVERLWWTVCNEDRLPSRWEDRLLAFSREDFSATSTTALWIKLPGRRWVDNIFGGFMQSRAKSYVVKVAEREVAIPFRDFSDSHEVADREQMHTFRIWVKDLDEIAVGTLPRTLEMRPLRVEVAPLASQFWTGHGRYKTAIAEVVLQKGTGEIWVNGQSVGDYFRMTPPKAMRFLQRLLATSEVRQLLARMDALVDVKGGSKTSVRQAKAVAHALARALMRNSRSLRPSLRHAGFGGVTVTKDGLAFKRSN